MIYYRILEGKLAGVYTQEQLEKKKQRKYVPRDGQAMEDWELISEKPSPQLISPRWEEGRWVESATSEEIERRRSNQNSATKNNLLENGVMAVAGNRNFHFTEADLMKFISYKNERSASGATTVNWLDSGGTWLDISLEEANDLALLAAERFHEIYKNNS